MLGNILIGLMTAWFHRRRCRLPVRSTAWWAGHHSLVQDAAAGCVYVCVPCHSGRQRRVVVCRPCRLLTWVDQATVTELR